MIDISFIYVFMREGDSQKYLHCYTTNIQLQVDTLHKTTDAPITGVF